MTEGRSGASEPLVVGLLAALNVLGNRAVPRGWEIPANLTAAAIMLAAARAAGADLRAYGLDGATFGRGFRLGAAVGLPLGVISATGAFLPATRPFFQGDLIVEADAGEAAYHVLLRIPHGTAVSEELIFRTALEGTLARRHSRLWTALAGAKLFGLWHILPAIDRLHSNPGVRGAHPVTVIAAAVGSTAVAGLGFSFLRDRSGSILAPIMVHAAVNAGAFAGGWIAHQRRDRERSS